MKVFAIADLHLPGNQEKPMNIFGDHWENHWEKIKENWQNKITDDDIVIIAGDISWAMNTQDAQGDIDGLAKLPGKQIFLKGNHDYWWASYSKVCDMLHENQYIIQNNSLKFGNIVVAGTRGWICPNSQEFKEKDNKIFKREGIRLELSLNDAVKKMDENSLLVVAMHYPPFAMDKKPTLFTQVIDKYAPKCVVFGHIHSRQAAKALEGNINNIEYIMCACDNIDFSPIQVL